MIKVFFLVLALALTAGLNGQQVWNKRISPWASPFPISSVAELHPGNNYLIAVNGTLVQLNELGEGTAMREVIPGAPSFWLANDFVKQDTDALSGQVQFWIGWQNLNEHNYHLGYYKPELDSFAHQIQFGENEFGGFSTRQPAIIENSETSVLVFSSEKVYNVELKDETPTILWSKPLSMPTHSYPNTAILRGNLYFLSTNLGDLLAVDNQGNQLWIKSNPLFIFRSLCAVSDGIVACGSDSTGTSTVAKFDLNGVLLWQRTFDAHAEINSIIQNSHQQLVCTGKSAGKNIILLALDQNGNTVWQNELQTGTGSRILEASDGGYFLTAVANNGVFAIKTDKNGQSTAPDLNFLMYSRELRENVFSIIQAPGSSSFFFNEWNFSSHWPADSSTKTIYMQFPWIGAHDESGTLHVSASDLPEVLDPDGVFQPGIISSTTGDDFNRVWALDRAEIAALRHDWAEDGKIDLPVPLDLLTWPAKGNPHFKSSLYFTKGNTDINKLPAPFIDNNHDGIYNVFDGDYPLLKGDRMIWWVFNDQARAGKPFDHSLGLDYLATMYAYDCPQNESVNQSFYLEYSVINRSNQSYSDAYFGYFTDFDIGCFEDDYLGSLPEQNTVYAYNMDDWDGAPNSVGHSAEPYVSDIPVQSMSFVDKTMDFAVNVILNHVNLNTADNYYSMLQGLLCGGQLPTASGNGCSNASAEPVAHTFNGNPADSLEWSMCSANIPASDKVWITSHGPFELAAGDTFRITQRFTYHTGMPLPCPDIHGLMKPAIEQLNAWFSEGTLGQNPDLGSVQTLPPGKSITLKANLPGAINYQWSTGTSSDELEVTQAGEYSVSVTLASGCIVVDHVLVKNSPETPSQGHNCWTIRPNPLSKSLHYELLETVPDPSLQLYNMQGVLARQIGFTGNQVDINVSDLPSGLYWVQIVSEGMAFCGQKVVKID